jgi:hypothetical protein
MEQPTTPPVDERNKAFENLRTLIVEAPIRSEYRIKILDALIKYIQTLN